MSTNRANQLVEAGLWLRLSGDPEGARRLLEQALALDPEHVQARRLLSESLPPEPIPPAPNPFKRSDAHERITEPGDPPANAWDSKSNPGVSILSIAPSMGAALDLVASDDAKAKGPAEHFDRSEVQVLLDGARDLLELDDHSGAMELILKAQELAPSDEQVQRLREKSERTLLNMYESKLGNLAAIPRVVVQEDEIIWLNLDHRAGFVLAQIDGGVSFEDLFAVSGMSRLDTARILAQLMEEGVISPR